MTTKDDLLLIYDIQRELTTLNSITALLDWDQNTHLPEKGLNERSLQFEMIKSLSYDKMTSSKLNSTLKRLIKDKSIKPNTKDYFVVHELNKEVQKLRKMPKEFVLKLTKQSVISMGVWQKARKENSYKVFMPELKKLIELKKQEAKYLNPKLKAYDALLNEFEEGMSSEVVSAVFDYLKGELVNLLQKIKSSKNYKSQKQIKLNIKQSEEENIIKDICHKMGLENSSTDIFTSAHPFTSRISQGDVRITTRYISFNEAFSGAIHEAGHALYELNLPKQYYGTVIHEAASYALHESQSRFWENMIGKNINFWRGYFKKIKKYVPSNTNSIKAFDFYKSYNQVKPSFIRVESDEVTYCLHIILRYEIERDLIEGKLDIKNAQSVWNEKMKKYLGITPKSDNEGILQDIHWSMGAFGYFPTYAIGTIYAAQLFMKMISDIPESNIQIKKSEFSQIKNWLTKKVHKYGKTMLADDIVKKATGQGLNAKKYVEYLNNKYKKIYDFS